jgi:hypothetical protein
MDWCVVKTGADMFDALHAYGLAVLLSHVTEGPVSLEDTGSTYALYSPMASLGPVKINVLDRVLALPSVEELQVIEKGSASTIEAANLDGLLAILFTTPGPRVLSVADLIRKQAFDPLVAGAALKKVMKTIEGRKRGTRKVSAGHPDWVQHMLRVYASALPVAPIPVLDNSNGWTMLMPIDPAFSFALRRVLSDGLLTRKCAIGIEGTLYAPLLTSIGAARFLRAQRLPSNMVGFYLPLASSVIVDPDTALPLLWEAAHKLSLERAVLSHCLEYSCPAARAGEFPQANSQWEALTYQILLTQGVQQSISYTRGIVDSSWLMALQQQVGFKVLRYWRLLASTPDRKMPYAVDNLLDALLTRNLRSWQAHLRELALCVTSGSGATEGVAGNLVRLYTLYEVKEITKFMDTSVSLPLSHVLQQDEGTIRFGHALRLLGRANPSILRDLVDELDRVHSLDSLLRTLTLLAQECELVSVKTPFIFVPTDDDLTHLLNDVDRYGARAIAGLLVILSALRYPRADPNTEEALTGFPIEVEEQDDDI